MITARIKGSAFIQDETAGIFISDGRGLSPGQLVEVTGEAGAGDFAPIIDKVQTKILGTAPMPRPWVVSAVELATGKYDCQWVETEGIVQSAGREGPSNYLTVVSGSHRYRVWVPDAGTPLPMHLIDAKIRLRGTAVSNFNERRQILGFRVWLPGWNSIEVLENAPIAPESLRPQPIQTLMQFDPDPAVGHRVRLQGTLTLRKSDGALFLKDATGGVLVQAAPDTPADVGDRLDVVGFPAAGDYLPVLQDAIVLSRVPGPPPPSAFITGDEALSGNYHAELVRIEAVLLDQVTHPKERILTLRSGRHTFSASIETSGTAAADDLRSGSLVAGHRRLPRHRRQVDHEWPRPHPGLPARAPVGAGRRRAGECAPGGRCSECCGCSRAASGWS